MQMSVSDIHVVFQSSANRLKEGRRDFEAVRKDNKITLCQSVLCYVKEDYKSLTH